MALAKLNSDYIMDGTTTLQNVYISEYMPTLPESVNRVYIYGLYLSGHADSPDNCLAGIASQLNLSETEVKDCFLCLSSLGLVQLINAEPIEVRYQPIKKTAEGKKYKPEKYADFNVRLQEILSDRTILPFEFQQYYDFLETSHMEQEALLQIVRYAATLKDKKVGYPYVLTIALNWHAEGINTFEQVEERLLESDRVATDLGAVYRALGTKKTAGFEDRQLFLKWTKGMEYDLDTIVAVAKTCKKGGTARLDAKLNRYYAAKLFTLPEISAYEKNTERLYGIARAVNKKLGLYYEQLDNVVDTYITVWETLGFEEETLGFVADLCFRRGVRTLEGMDATVKRLYRQGTVTQSAIAAKLDELAAYDNRILEIFSVCGVTDGTVRARDRDFYRTWTYSWELPHDLVLYAATLAKGAAQPLPYMNKILGDWRAKNIRSVEEAKRAGTAAPEPRPSQQAIQTHEYTREQLNALIDNLDEVDF